MSHEEEEAWKELEKRMGRKEVKEVMVKLDAELDVYRNDVIDEVADAVSKFEVPFGADTVASFVVFIRGLKNEPRARM
jgi:hypothetical protein